MCHRSTQYDQKSGYWKISVVRAGKPPTKVDEQRSKTVTIPISRGQLNLTLMYGEYEQRMNEYLQVMETQKIVMPATGRKKGHKERWLEDLWDYMMTTSDSKSLDWKEALRRQGWIISEDIDKFEVRMTLAPPDPHEKEEPHEENYVDEEEENEDGQDKDWVLTDCMIYCHIR